MGLVLIRAATGRLAFVLPPTTPITTTTTRLQLAKPPTRSRICGGGRGVGHVQQKHARSATTPTMTTISIHGYSARNGIRGIRSTRLFCSAGGVGVVAMSTEHNIQAMMADDEQEQCDGLVARPREQEGLTDIQPVLRKYLEMDNDGSVKKVA